MLNPPISSTFPNIEELIDSFDWSQTKLGSKNQWPLSLKITLSWVLKTNIPIIIYWGKDYIALYNDAYAALIGPKHPILLGQPLELAWPERKNNFNKIAQIIHQGETIKYISTYKNPGDTKINLERDIEINFSPISDENNIIQGILSIIIEITDQTTRTTTSESVEQLIGGLAHDFNTLLGGIIGNLELMSMRLHQNKTECLPRYIHAAQQAAAQASVITNQLLSFSRRQTLVPHITDPNHALQALTDKFNVLTQEYIKHPTHLCFDLENDIWSIFCDPEQLKNALINIFINACEAVHPSNGKITIKSENITVSHNNNQYLFIKPNDYILITIQDNGIGMDAKTIKKATDPFFTTKPLGKRAGLGLSMAYGFTKQSGGYLIIESKPQIGTKVKLYLPRYHRPLVVEKFFIDSLKEKHPNILIISNDQHLRIILGENLEDLGYVTTATKTEKEANSLLKSNTQFKFIIIDSRTLVQAENNLVTTIQKQYSELPILLITGYEDHPINLKELLNEKNIFVIRQPILPSSLAEKIKSIQTFLQGIY